MNKKQKIQHQAAGKEPSFSLITLMVFLSGMASLVYQLLWMRQLGLLFGNTSQASSVTLAAFFIGLGLGSWWWGQRMRACANPLRVYAFLEFAIAGTALIYFPLLAIFHWIYPWFYQSLAGDAALFSIKILLSLLLIFPPAFFMGGTIPVIGQAAIQRASAFGMAAAFLYATNVLGAALGVGLGAFFLIPSVGFQASYAITILISVGVGGIAWWLARGSQSAVVPPGSDEDAAVGEEERVSLSKFGRALIGLLCFFSGFLVLALEVTWIRIFAQVHENSVYSFAIVLIVVLLCLAIGSAISSFLSKRSGNPMVMLGALVLTGGLSLLAGPYLLMQATNELQPVQTIESWGEHVASLFRMSFGGIGLVVIALGTIFPFLMKMAERFHEQPGQKLGWMFLLNTLGAILGSLLCGFVFLPYLGMWQTFAILTAVYLVIAAVLPIGWGKSSLVCRGLAVVALALLFSKLNPSHLPVMGFASADDSREILEVWEESDATVAVLERADGHRSIVVNAAYSLGSTAAFAEQANQSRIPLYLFPKTESICFIGLGTGISAGAALDDAFPNVKRIVSCELSEAVVEAAQRWIPEAMTGGIFTDPRSTILIEDGRHYLMATGETFDMINADLFLPYRRGTGSLYSRDLYELAKKRLNPGGVYVQWLPLYQITSDEFAVIAKTMLESFDQVSMWRNNFFPGAEKVALVGQMETAPVEVPPGGDKEAMKRAVEGLQLFSASPDMVQVEPESIAFFYAGNLTEAARLFEGFPVNTDNRPFIEYEAPIGFRKVAAFDDVIWNVGPKLVNWIARIFEAAPLTEDPIFKGHPPEILSQIRSGEAFHQAMVYASAREVLKAQTAWEAFKKYWRAGAR